MKMEAICSSEMRAKFCLERLKKIDESECLRFVR
jgi:hypothetical protein